MLPFAAAALLVWMTGCSQSTSSPQAAAQIALETPADSLAMRVYDYMGGPEAWRSVTDLRFDFAAAMNGKPQSTRRHLWNRQTGEYRLEWPTEAGTYVALFNTNNSEGGQIFFKGDTVGTAQRDTMLQTARRTYINDTYWFIMPTKLFDSGVARSIVPDSSTESTAVLHLTFADSVGMTPRDRYWLYVDRKTGRLKEWRYQLQGGNNGHFMWKDYQTLKVPAGTVRVATRKQGAGGGAIAILTDSVSMPKSVPDSLFSTPRPVLSAVSFD